jgi:N-acetylglucosamine kinase-like BadF-type ATPase
LLSARSFANLSPYIAEHAANLDALSIDIVKQGSGERAVSGIAI